MPIHSILTVLLISSLCSTLHAEGVSKRSRDEFAELAGKGHDDQVTIAQERGKVTLPIQLMRSGTMLARTRWRTEQGAAQNVIRASWSMNNEGVRVGSVTFGTATATVAGPWLLSHINGVLSYPNGSVGLTDDQANQLKEAARDLLLLLKVPSGVYSIGAGFDFGGESFKLIRYRPIVRKALFASSLDHRERGQAFATYPLKAGVFNEIVIDCAADGRISGIDRLISEQVEEDGRYYVRKIAVTIDLR